MHLTTGFGMDADNDGYDDDNDDNASDAGDVESLAPLDQLVLQNNRKKKRQESMDDINANEFKKREKCIIHAQALWRCKVDYRNYQTKLASIRTIQTNWGGSNEATYTINT